MNKKTSITILILLLIILSNILFFFNKSKITKLSGEEKGLAIYQMSGKVTQVEGSYIYVQGLVGSEEKTIKFLTTPQTKFRLTIITITEEQIKSGKPFQGKTIAQTGSLDDLKTLVKKQSISVSKITSPENLLNEVSPAVDEIFYIIHDFQDLQTK